MIIREEQLKKFSEVLRRGFEDRLFACLKQALPVHAEKFGDERTRRAIQLGVERAAACGIRSEIGTARFVQLLFLFDRDFERNPRYPWATQVMADPGISGDARAERLVQSAMSALRAVAAGNARNRPIAGLGGVGLIAADALAALEAPLEGLTQDAVGDPVAAPPEGGS
ncbi:MAG: hypothetical protein ACM3ZB_14170 [bacterium]|jgi:hypothetical protein